MSCRLRGQLGRERVVELAGRRGRARPPAALAQLERIGVVARPQRRLDHVHPDDHAGAAAVGRVVHLAGLERRSGAQVDELELVPELERVRTWRWLVNQSNQRREERDHVDLHPRNSRSRWISRAPGRALIASDTSGTSVPSSSSSSAAGGPVDHPRRPGRGRPRCSPTRSAASHSSSPSSSSTSSSSPRSGARVLDPGEPDQRALVGARRGARRRARSSPTRSSVPSGERVARAVDPEAAVEAVRLAHPPGGDERQSTTSTSTRVPWRTADALIDRAQRRDRPAAAADHLAGVVLADVQLEHDGAVVLLEGLDAHLVRAVDERPGEIGEKVVHLLRGRTSPPRRLGGVGARPRRRRAASAASASASARLASASAGGSASASAGASPRASAGAASLRLGGLLDLRRAAWPAPSIRARPVAGLAAATAAEVLGSAVRPFACAFISCLTVPVGCAPRATQCWRRSSSITDRRGLGLRVVVADRLDEAAVARRALVGDDHAPDRILLAPHAGEANSYGHRPEEVSDRRRAAAGSASCPSRSASSASSSGRTA